mgnify:FL=1
MKFLVRISDESNRFNLMTTTEFADDSPLELPSTTPDQPDPPPDRIAVEHACNVVRRLMQEDREDLTLFCIVHGTGERAKALATKKREILAHPAGAKLYPVLERLAQKKDDYRPSALAAYATGKTQAFFRFMAEEQGMVCFFVNIDHFEKKEHVRQHAESLIWHALDFVQKVEERQVDFYTLTDGVAAPRFSPVQHARNNLLADVFSVFLAEMQGQKNAIRELARRRCLLTITPIPPPRPRAIPTPLRWIRPRSSSRNTNPSRA